MYTYYVDIFQFEWRVELDLDYMCHLGVVCLVTSYTYRLQPDCVHVDNGGLADVALLCGEVGKLQVSHASISAAACF